MDRTLGPQNVQLVTIGIATRNRAATTLPQALESALLQTYPNVEVVVCDNASTDGTEDLLRTNSHERLAYHRHPKNIGANANFNSCLARARGDYFILLHDDDVLETTFVERAMNVVKRNTPGVVLSGVRLIDYRGQVSSEVRPPPPDLARADLFLHWFAKRFSFYLVSTMYHTEHLRGAGGFESPEALFQDVIATARLVGRHGYVSVPGVAGSFRRHEASRTARTAQEDPLRWIRDSAYLLKVLCEEMPEAESTLRRVGGCYLSAMCYRHASAERSWWIRRASYREIYEGLGRSLPPWRYRIGVIAKRYQWIAKRLVAAVRARHLIKKRES